MTASRSPRGGCVAAFLRSHVRVLALGAVGLVFFLREPALLLAPRFWAEEATVYFAYALHHPWYRVLLAPHLGYFALAANLATLLAARIAPLTAAPLFTTLFAFGVQLLPVAVILWGSSHLWRTPARKLAAILVIVFVGASGEIWLNTINSQFHLAVLAFLIAAEDVKPVQAARRWTLRGLLLLCGLSGAVAVSLAPVFVLKAYWERERERIVHASIIAACGLVQGAVFAASLGGSGVPSRLRPVNVFTVATVIIAMDVVAPVIGHAWDREVIALAPPYFRALAYHVLPGADRLLAAADPWLGWVSGLIVGGLACGFVVLFRWLMRRLPGREVAVFAASFALLSVYSVLFSAEVMWAQRYAHAPGLVFMLAVLSSIRRSEDGRFPASSKAAALILGVALLHGIVHYRAGLKHFFRRDWPVWRQEVLIVQRDPEHRIRVHPRWPHTDWGLTLSEGRFPQAPAEKKR